MSAICIHPAYKRLPTDRLREAKTPKNSSRNRSIVPIWRSSSLLLHSIPPLERAARGRTKELSLHHINHPARAWFDPKQRAAKMVALPPAGRPCREYQTRRPTTIAREIQSNAKLRPHRPDRVGGREINE